MKLPMLSAFAWLLSATAFGQTSTATPPAAVGAGAQPTQAITMSGCVGGGTNAQPFVLNNCATSGCHGTFQGAKFSLIAPADSEAAMYTNFYTLQSYLKKAPAAAGGANVFGRGELRIIDRQMPAQSLLLQYGLPPAIAELDHPEVPNYRAPYRGFNDARYQQVLRWISESLVPVPPDYGFTVGPTPASQPATQPAPPAPPPTRPTPPGARPPAGQPPTPRPMPTGGGAGTGGRPAQPTR